MNKSHLARALGKEYNLTAGRAEEIVDILFEAMAKALVNGDRVEIRGFGSFTIKEHDGYSGRNPKTGDTIRVKPKKLPLFRVGKGLLERLNRD